MGSLDPIFFRRPGPNLPTCSPSVCMHVGDYLIAFAFLGLCRRNDEIFENLRTLAPHVNDVQL